MEEENDNANIEKEVLKNTVPEKLEDVKEPKMSIFQKGINKKAITLIGFIGVAIVGVIFSLGIVSFEGNQGLLNIIFIAGFLPIGAMAGFLIADPKIRITLLRNTTRRNYGFVHFVSRGNTKFTFIKDLDDDVIMDKKGRTWVIETDKIYSTKEPKHAYEIMGSNISTQGGIPEIYFSIESMRPLTFYKQEEIKDAEGKSINPQRAGAAIKTTIAAETAKGLLGNKTVTVLGIIGLILSAGAVYFAYDTNTLVHQWVDVGVPLAEGVALQTQANIINQPLPGA